MSVKIPILDLSPEFQQLGPEIMKEVERVFRAGAFIMGPDVKAFEDEAAKYLGVKHAVGLNSGTDALVIGLRALGVDAGDEVITTPFTFFATAEAISQLGATPVFVDVDERSFNLDVSQVEKCITPKTKAIIPVHLYGQCCDMDPLMKIAEKHGLKVLEDVAQAFGSEYRGKKAGSIGHAGAYSFFPSKNLGCYGDGGLLTTNDDAVAEMARMLRVHGSKKKYHNEVIGYNSRLDTVQAAILRVKLKHIDTFNEGRRQVARRYNELLSAIPDLVTPLESSFGKHVYHQYTIRLTRADRDQVHKKLEAQGIGTMIYYPIPVNQLPVYRDLPNKGTDPKSRLLTGQVLSLPIWPQMEASTQQHVVDVLRASL
jgi:dTDP-4-amino-4,6-dideoxygalactose transaminase